MNRRLRVGVLIFLAAWLPYLVVGVYLATEVHLFFGDALSRVQSAQSVLFSRTPRLSAIGFVFTPLTAVVQLPLVALSPWWPEMTTHALSAVIMSSMFMAGSVVQVSGIARDRGLDPVVAAVFTICYAANPMVVLYGANGMSEAPYLFFLAWASRRLIRWVSTDDVHELVVAGIALALSYLTRYDGGAAALAAGCVVGWVTYRRRDGRKRLSRSLVDITLVVAPSALAFLAWAATGWLITGNAFAQFTSEYGNAAIIAQSGGSGSSTTSEAIWFSITELAILAPLLPILVVGLIGVRARRHRLSPLLPGLMIVAVLAFQVFGYARGSTFGFLRFYMTVILLAAIVALMSVPLRRPIPMRRAGAHADPAPVRPYASRWGVHDRVHGGHRGDGVGAARDRDGDDVTEVRPAGVRAGIGGEPATAVGSAETPRTSNGWSVRSPPNVHWPSTSTGLPYRTVRSCVTPSTDSRWSCSPSGRDSSSSRRTGTSPNGSTLPRTSVSGTSSPLRSRVEVWPMRSTSVIRPCTRTVPRSGRSSSRRATTVRTCRIGVSIRS
ncbi:hypothetical protein BPODLACK_00010 [Gordonia sp. YY1]|nr:hypothetical protein BPODLACK_00010 [Gordonia sp. YY1]